MRAVNTFMKEMVADMARGELYRASLTKRSRRTRIEIETIKAAIQRLLANENPMTVRQVFYRLVILVEEAITQHIDKEVLHTTTVVERSERELLRAWGKQLAAGAP